LFQGYFENDLAKAWTISLTTLAVFQWFNAWNCRSESKSIFRMDFFSNKFLLGATTIVVLLQLLAVYAPVLQDILHTVPLAASEWLMIVAVAASIIAVEEIRKFFYRRIRVEAMDHNISNWGKDSSVSKNSRHPFRG
jgi:magnesium-transporting ATPase (P-type)